MPKPIHKMTNARRLAELEERVRTLESEAWRRAFPTAPAPAEDSRSCRVCGGLWENMTNYVCFNPGCPSRITCNSNQVTPHA